MTFGHFFTIILATAQKYGYNARKNVMIHGSEGNTDSTFRKNTIQISILCVYGFCDSHGRFHRS